MNSFDKDKYETPLKEIEKIIQLIPPNKILYEPFPGTGKFAEFLEEKGFRVVYDTKKDFFKDFKSNNLPEFDMIVTNPPFSKKKQFIQCLKVINKPFLVLMPIQSLPFFNIFAKDKEQFTFEETGLELILLRKRIKFIYDGTVKRSPTFHSVWLKYE